MNFRACFVSVLIVANFFSGAALAACKDFCKAPRVCSGDPPHENCLVPFKLSPDHEIQFLGPAKPEDLPIVEDMVKKGKASVE